MRILDWNSTTKNFFPSHTNFIPILKRIKEKYDIHIPKMDLVHLGINE